MRYRAGVRWLLGVALVGGAARAQEPAVEAAVQTVGLEKTKPILNDPLLEGTERFAQGATEVTEVNLDKNMMAMAAKFLDKSDAEAQRLMKQMEFVNVKSYEYGKAGAYRMEDVAQFRGRLDEKQWSHVVRNRSATEATDIWIKADEQGAMSELLVIAAEPTQLTFVHLKGRMSVEDLEKAGASYGVPQTTKLKGAK